MTSSAPLAPRTVWDVLCTDDGIGQLSQRLASSELRSRALKLPATASRVAHQVLDRKLLDGVTQLLQQLNLASLVIEGWRTYNKLTDAAHRSRSTPERPEKVVLSNHQITSKHQPTIDVIINETQRCSVRLTLTITFDLHVVRAVVQNGALVALESGSCLVGVTLAIDNVPGELKRERELPAAAVLQMHSPVPLLPEPSSWCAVITPDRGYFEAGGADTKRFSFPAGSPTRRVKLTGPSVRIGRRSDSRDTTPEIDLADPWVSREHAQLLAQPDGTWTVVDEGSTNGTYVNDDRRRIPTHQQIPLADGDCVHLGIWTMITLYRGP